MKKTTIIIGVLLSLTIISSSITIWSLFFRETENHDKAPDYAPIEIEENATDIENETKEPEKKPVEQPKDDVDSPAKEENKPPKGSGSVSMTYSPEITIDLSEQLVTLYFVNPEKSSQDIVLMITLQDKVIVESGRLIPGYKLSKLSLPDEFVSELQPGQYDGSFQVFYYDQDSAEKAIVNTELPIAVTIKK